MRASAPLFEFSSVPGCASYGFVPLNICTRTKSPVRRFAERSEQLLEIMMNS